ncbi:hypothetical protein BC830DRAFT_1078635 [Chytriomyces sp. MP71]|nr:hypothetical protein BC830DRAFT_1078635 [Chytriomyces sp. MP71]
MRLQDQEFVEMGHRRKKFMELTTLHIDKLAVAHQQLLEEERVNGQPVTILGGRAKVSKTNHYERAEHFAFFYAKNVLEWGWGWCVEEKKGYKLSEGNMEMFTQNIDPPCMKLAACNGLDSQQACYSFSVSLPASHVLAKCKKEPGM